MSNAFVGQNGYYFIYNGCPIGYTWSASWSNGIPNIIIKRNSGSAQRPAIAVRDPNHMLPTETPESVSEALAFSSPYYYSANEWREEDCFPLRVATGSASPELGYAVYYNYEPNSTDYIYLRTPLVAGGYYDLTNGGYSGWDNVNNKPVYGEAEIIRYRDTSVSGCATFNLSDYTAVRNFYAPNYGNIDGLANYEYTIAPAIADGGTGNNTPIQTYPQKARILELENFYAPNFCDFNHGWEAVTSVKNVDFFKLGSLDYNPSFKYIEDFSGRSEGNIVSATIKGDVYLKREWTPKFVNSTIGYGKATRLDYQSTASNTAYTNSAYTYIGKYENAPSGVKSDFSACDINPNTILYVRNYQTTGYPFNEH
jgi:hypothetical protein